MTKALMLRVLRESIVDTEKYRYTYREAHDERGQWLEFIRLPIKALDMTTAIDGWEIVKRAGWRPARIDRSGAGAKMDIYTPDKTGIA